MIEKSPLVSIILPTYNRANLLPRAIESILSQDYQNFEIILVDDGSTDDTSNILSNLNHNRIIPIRIDHNQGIGNARHTGVTQANGDFIAFLDSDDTWLPGKLSMQVEAFGAFPQVEFIFGNYWNINQMQRTKLLGFSQTAKSMQRMKVKLLSEKLDLWQILDGYVEAILDANFFATPTVMFRRDILNKVGNFNRTLNGSEDFEFWWRSALIGVVMAYTKHTLIERYKDKDSLTAQTIPFTTRRLITLDICQQTAMKNNRPDLIKHLDHSRLRNWTGLIYAHALHGERPQAINAFQHSLHYGVSSEAWIYLLAALAGPRIINWVKRGKKMVSA